MFQTLNHRVFDGAKARATREAKVIVVEARETPRIIITGLREFKRSDCGATLSVAGCNPAFVNPRYTREAVASE